MQGLCLACLSLFSEADIHANWLPSSVSFVFVKPRRPETQWVSGGIGSCVLQRSVELHCYHWMDENYIMNALYAESMYSEIKIQGLPMMPLLICMLHVLIGFHQLIPFLFFLISLGCLSSLILSFHSPLSSFVAICVNLCTLNKETFHTDAAAKERKTQTCWLDWMLASFMCKYALNVLSSKPLTAQTRSCHAFFVTR